VAGFPVASACTAMSYASDPATRWPGWALR
jgi:hypothetical protein